MLPCDVESQYQHQNGTVVNPSISERKKMHPKVMKNRLMTRMNIAARIYQESRNDLSYSPGVIFSLTIAAIPSIGTRSCSMVSRSRMVTVESCSVW